MIGLAGASRANATGQAAGRAGRGERALAIGFVALTTGLLGWAVAREWSGFPEAARRLPPAFVVGAFGAVLAGLLCSAFAWRQVVLAADEPPDEPMTRRTGLRVFFVGQLGKYLPGGVWPVFAQVRIAGSLGLSRAKVATAAIFVMVLNVASGIVVGFALLGLSRSGTLTHYAWLLAVLPAALLVLHPRTIDAGAAVASRMLGRDRPHRLSGPRLATALAWTLAMWVCYGASVAMLAYGLGDRGGRPALEATGAFALAWVAGFLLVVAPAGFGPREVVLVAVLAPRLGVGAATALAVVSRVLMTVGDLVWGGAVLVRRSPDSRRWQWSGH